VVVPHCWITEQLHNYSFYFLFPFKNFILIFKKSDFKSVKKLTHNGRPSYLFKAPLPNRKEKRKTLFSVFSLTPAKLVNSLSQKHPPFAEIVPF
jgi:hypothetical protein